MANAKNIELVVITPEKQVLSAEVASVVIPAHDGELGILHDRAPFMCELGVGQLRYQDTGGLHRVLFDGGFAQVHENRVTVLTNRAVPAKEVTPDLIKSEETLFESLTGADHETAETRLRTRARIHTLRALQSAR